VDSIDTTISFVLRRVRGLSDVEMLLLELK
jgi:hypothetical protein